MVKKDTCHLVGGAIAGTPAAVCPHGLHVLYELKDLPHSHRPLPGASYTTKSKNKKRKKKMQEIIIPSFFLFFFTPFCPGLSWDAKGAQWPKSSIFSTGPPAAKRQRLDSGTPSAASAVPAPAAAVPAPAAPPAPAKKAVVWRSGGTNTLLNRLQGVEPQAAAGKKKKKK